MSSFDGAFETLDIARSRLELSGQGWTLLPDPMSPDLLVAIKGQIDQIASAGETEVNYGGSEHRVWQAHQQSPEIDAFRRFSDRVMSAVEGRERAAHDVLAIRNQQLTSADAKLRMGRWHLDSFRRQLKIFVFLTNVSSDSGPFEILPGTHARLPKAKELLKGKRITVRDLIGRTRTYSSLPEASVDDLVAKGYSIKTFDVSAGTAVLVDTSCVHRARPCLSGSRYALTTYYR